MEGKYRCDTVKNGLKKIKNSYSHVLIHDAARADVSIKLIKKIIKQLKMIVLYHQLKAQIQQFIKIHMSIEIKLN